MKNRVSDFTSPDMFRGEIRRRGVAVTRNDGQVLGAITGAKYQIFKRNGTKVMDEAVDATVSGGKNIYANIAAGNEPGAFFVQFSWQVDDFNCIAKVHYNVI